MDPMHKSIGGSERFVFPSRMLDDWNLLRSFVAVVEAGSLSEASTRLDMTQSSVSRHMRELERLFGETLFDRRPSGVVALEPALKLYGAVRGMQDLVRRAEGLVGEAPERVTGVVRITTSVPFAVHVLPAWLTSLLHDEPGLEIELHATEQIENLLRRDADIAIRFTRPVQEGVIARSVGTVAVGLYASDEYIARHGAPSTMDEAASHLLIGGDDITTAIRIGTFQAPHGIRFRLRTDSLLARLASVEAGMGIGPVLVNLAQTRPHLRRVLSTAVHVPLEIWLCGHEDLRRSARIRRVYDHLCERLLANFGEGGNVSSEAG